MDKIYFDLIADKVGICAEWAANYDKFLADRLKDIENELREVKE